MYKKPDFEPSRAEMLGILEQQIQSIKATESVSLLDSLGRTCANDIYAINTLPNSKFSKMDGVAVRFADFATGEPDTSTWREGHEYVFSNTGCAIPNEYDTVIAIERVSFDEQGRITVLLQPSMIGNNVGEPGSQVMGGELLVAAGQVITPPLIGLLAAGGYTFVEVLIKPKVAFIPTGDELVPAGWEVPLHKNVESNSIMLAAFLKQWGAEPIIFPIIPDVFEKLAEAVKKATEIADLVIICAGSSKGTKDFTMDMLESIGEVIVHELGHGPGKHCSLAIVNEKIVIGLPGPMMGAELTANYYVRNALQLMNRQPITLCPTLNVILTEELKGMRFDFVLRLFVYKQNGSYYAKPVSIGSLTRANANRVHNAETYVPKEAVYQAGQTVAAELHCPLEHIKEVEA